uniref:Uncharacterized protein n=1 Tax=Haptolina brevifila TaxID=156173 RepID=A0A7S2N2Q7_9EUKA
MGGIRLPIGGTGGIASCTWLYHVSAMRHQLEGTGSMLDQVAVSPAGAPVTCALTPASDQTDDTAPLATDHTAAAISVQVRDIVGRYHGERAYETYAGGSAAGAMWPLPWAVRGLRGRDTSRRPKGILEEEEDASSGTATVIGDRCIFRPNFASLRCRLVQITAKKMDATQVTSKMHTLTATSTMSCSRVTCTVYMTAAALGWSCTPWIFMNGSHLGVSLAPIPESGCV